MDPRLTRLRALWAADISAMKAGTYTAPLPHPCMFVDDQNLTKGQRIQDGRRRAKLFRSRYGQEKA